MATKLDIYQDAARIVADARLSTLTDEVELRYVFDDAYDTAVTQVLRESGWRFATETAVLVPATGAGLPGYANRFEYPANWLRTISIFVLAGARECPVDLRELGPALFSNEPTLVLRFVSKAGADETKWTSQFKSVVAAYLAFLCVDRLTGDPARAQDVFSLYQARLSEAAQIDAETANPWLASQRDGSFLRAARTVLRMGFWRFAMRTATLVLGGTPVAGFANSFTKPADWLGTQAAFTTAGARECPVDLREETGAFSTNAPTLTIRYTSTIGLDAKIWPDTFHAAVKATLAAEVATGEARAAAFKEVQASVSLSLSTDGMGEDQWLASQRDGSFLRSSRMVLAAGFWRFAMKTLPLLPSGVPVTGFLYAFPKPSDWIQTQAVFRPSGSREAPVDLREDEIRYSADVPDMTIRYTSTDALDSRSWPDSFYSAVRAALMANGATGEERVAALREMERAIALSISADGMPESVWLDSQRDGTFIRTARAVLEMGFWRFSTRTAELGSTGLPVAGFTNAFDKPEDWLRTQAAFQLLGTREAPVDLREEVAGYSTNAETLAIRYTSSTALDARLWPDSFYSAVKVALAANAATGETRDAAFKEMQVAVALSIATDGMAEDPWLVSQRDGSFLRAARAVLEMGFWRFATKTAPLTEGGLPTAGFARAFAKPLDWLRTLSAFVLTDAREHPVALREEGSTFSTDATALTIRYTSTEALDARRWPDSVYAAVRAALAANAAIGEARPIALKEMQQAVAVSLATDGVPDDPWYRFQRSDAFAQGVIYVLSQGRWRFASKTTDLVSSGVPTAGMSYRYPLPTDWLRTINLSTLRYGGGDLVDVDFHEEGGALHTDASPVSLRYVTKAGLDATMWPEGFRDVVLAYLEYREARDDPSRANVAASKLTLYRERSKSAELKDDQSERPRINQIGRLVRGRFGGPYGEQGRRW